MSVLQNAFNLLLGLHKRNMTIERPGVVGPFMISATPSNYSRNLAGPEETVIGGREFLIAKRVLDSVAYPTPRRGDRLEDAESGHFEITEVREMYDLGGEIMGFRIRTS